MGEESWIVAAAILAFLLGLYFVWRPLRLSMRRARFCEARRAFHWQRERLEAKFFVLAQENSRPGAPYWTDCRFDDDVAYVRNRLTGELSAFVAVAIAAEDLQVGQGDTPKIVQIHRTATAVFQFNGRHWDTDGRIIYDLSPSETLQAYRRDLEVVGQEPAGHLQRLAEG